MIEMEKVLDALNTDKGTTLLAVFSKLFLQKNSPENVDDVEYVKAASMGAVKTISEEQTVPEGFDTQEYILGILASMIKSLEAELGVADDDTSAAESIPPRPFPNGSRYLNPEEVNWLLKYDPKVKSSAERYVRWYRKERGGGYLSDDMILESSLGMLYKLNRRDPSIVEQLPGAGPSFFKQYEEGTPEEIVIRYLNSSSGSEKDYEKPKTTYSGPKTTSSKHSSASNRKAELLEQKKHNQILGVVFLLVFWPVGIYFFYKASQISKEINSL